MSPLAQPTSPAVGPPSAAAGAASAVATAVPVGVGATAAAVPEAAGSVAALPLSPPAIRAPRDAESAAADAASAAALLSAESAEAASAAAAAASTAAEAAAAAASAADAATAAAAAAAVAAAAAPPGDDGQSPLPTASMHGVGRVVGAGIGAVEGLLVSERAGAAVSRDEEGAQGPAEGYDPELEAEAILEAHRRIDASWSEPFMRTSLFIVRNSRRAIMSSLKSLELRNREHAVADVREFVSEIGRDGDRALRIVTSAGKQALI